MIQFKQSHSICQEHSEKELCNSIEQSKHAWKQIKIFRTHMAKENSCFFSKEN